MWSRVCLIVTLAAAWVWTSPLAAQIIAGTDPVTGNGVVDGWACILYLNEETPFDFTTLGEDRGVLTTVSFWVIPDRATQGVVTPFVAEPLVDAPLSGDDFVVRAIGTTRAAGADWNTEGLHHFPFHDTQTFVVENGWLAGFLSSDPQGLRLDATSPIPFEANKAIDGWLTGTSSAGAGSPAVTIGALSAKAPAGHRSMRMGCGSISFRSPPSPWETALHCRRVMRIRIWTSIHMTLSKCRSPPST